MVKKLCMFLLFALHLHADILDDKVRNLIGEQSYQTNANFINRIFANKNLYYTNGRLDMAKMVYSLKSNGLLASRFGQPSEVRLSFVARTSPILLTKIINNILSSMGYSYFVVIKAEHSNGLSTMEFSFNTEHSPDMGIIIDELSRRGFVCLDINRISPQKWEYTLEVNEPRLPNTRYINKTTSLNLREVSGEYWLSVDTSGDLQIQTIDFPKWNPRVVLYDKNLTIVDFVANTSATSSLKIRIPNGVRFVMITDFDNPESLKNGISVALN